VTFSPPLLEALRRAEEVVIQTQRDAKSPVHRTIIWVVVDDKDRVLVRAVRGPRSRWFREALASGEVALEADRVSTPMRAEHATDKPRIEAASAAYREKYARHSSTRTMVADRNLPATLELLPR